MTGNIYKDVHDHNMRQQPMMNTPPPPPGQFSQRPDQAQGNLPPKVPPEIANMPNPFQNPAFNNPLPDLPIQDQGAAMLNALLNDDTVPEKLKQDFWFVFHRDNILTFLDQPRKYSKMLNFDILKIDSLNATPYYNYTFDQEKQWNAARQMFETKLDRALGNSKGQNERTVIPMTIQENITRMEDKTSGGGEVKEGFLRRMLNRR
jgi:hypothetical protein